MKKIVLLVLAVILLGVVNLHAEPGDVNVEGKLKVDKAISGFGVVPVGSIVAWHKSLENTPELPDGWVECNGQTLNDPDSQYNTQTIPNLNAASGYNGGRFLRGGTTSGTMQEATKHLFMAANAQPSLSFPALDSIYNAHDDNDGYFGGGAYMSGINVDPSTNWHVGDTLRASRPVNMSVVWIMRVK